MRKQKSLTQKQKVTIYVAIIAALGVIGAGYLQSPLANNQWEKRPVVDMTLGDGHDFPKKLLQLDKDGYYFVDILMRNRGQSDGKILATVVAENASVNFDKNQDFLYAKDLRYNIIPLKNYTASMNPIYVKPNENIGQFSITLSVINDNSPPTFQEINLMKPAKLIFTKSGNEYILLRQE